MGARHHGPTILERFLAAQSDRTVCWVYPGSVNRQTGYGKAWFREHRAVFDAHRAAYIMLRGEVPDGLTLDHLCRNRPCCNPWHLEAVPIRTNLLRGESPSARQARQTRCIHGHLLSGDNLYVDKRKRRHCVECRRFRVRESYYRRTGNRPVPEIRADLHTHCAHGHAWTAATTYRTKEGTRLCRICQTAHQRAFRARQAAISRA